MPKGKIDYSNSYIYKLCCKNVNIKEEYVGSTSNMRNRKYKHKQNCRNKTSIKYNYLVYQFIRNNGGFENWDMILVEKYNATDNADLRKRERYWKEQLQSSLNSNNCYISKEEALTKKNEYYYNNKDEILLQMKIHRDKNPELYKKRRTQYYNDNKDEMNKNYDCECGGKYTHAHKSRHFKTVKHKNYLLSLCNLG